MSGWVRSGGVQYVGLYQVRLGQVGSGGLGYRVWSSVMGGDRIEWSWITLNGVMRLNGVGWVESSGFVYLFVCLNGAQWHVNINRSICASLPRGGTGSGG